MSSDSVKVAARIRPQNVREQAQQYPLTTIAKDSTVLTGSGKTYTMGTGFEPNAVSSEAIGIVPRAVDQIFETIHEVKMQAKEADEFEPKFTIEAQFIELYNEDLVDLLTHDKTTIVRIQENPGNGQIVIRNAISIPVKSADEVFDILKKGTFNRTTGSTNMNEKSSRSHAIFSLHIKQEKFEPTEGDEKLLAVLTAKLHFVDLAGSERLKRTGATGDRAKEGISINCGLLALGNVISALTAPKKIHIPYRDSKLTRFLQDSLGGNSRTLMIACASPSNIDAIETMNTLTYATRAKGIKNHVTVNKDHEAASIVQLKSRIATLETELAEYKMGNKTVQKPPEEIDLVETFTKSSTTVLETFKKRVDEALGDKPQLDLLVRSQQELIALSSQFKEGLESHLHVLSIPCKAKNRRERRTTIFNSAQSRKGRDRNPITTLISIPSISFDDEHPVDKKNDKLSSENKENGINPINDDLISKLQEEVAVHKRRAERAEQECRHNEQKADNTIKHLHDSIVLLKHELSEAIANKAFKKA
ncbi:Kinesin-like protein [Aphelenchoides bicaudatus]|nr:Kinesin-like protein [Aphelenchoides bicaudatus]